MYICNNIRISSFASRPSPPTPDLFVSLNSNIYIPFKDCLLLGAYGVVIKYPPSSLIPLQQTKFRAERYISFQCPTFVPTNLANYRFSKGLGRYRVDSWLLCWEKCFSNLTLFVQFIHHALSDVM